MNDQAAAGMAAGASITRNVRESAEAEAHGRFLVVCRDAEGREKWRDTIENTVCTEGKNVMLDAALAGAAYTVVGPFMGLISSVGWSATAASDTAAQINGTNGWKEAGLANAPTYTAPRKTCVWSAAASGSKALSAALTFAITGTGTVKGCFLVFFTGAVSTIDSTTGKLWAAGVFSGGDRAVLNGDTLSVSYSTSL